ncbi:SDR family oxidoreductase [Pseudomonas citronellolis]|uniref:SDR family NAD(P)-dependent oxidoreductase n=1 Tax=Pseudomonas citronellolis TaxID=53408 RepID=UPI0026498B29|nr:SDR family oxidoreductase [Pseudomonas citronellolis]MDN6875419.1 SDR family oxidoreductase [Pseudomonas citronellolis]
MRLKGKNILVSGGSNGIGRAIVEGYRKEGASVFFSYLNDAESADRVCKNSSAYSTGGIWKMRCDLANSHEAQAWVTKAIETLSHIDVLVNNAAVFSRHAFLDITNDEFSRVMKVNITNTFLVSQAVTRHMMKQGIQGSLIHISSLSAKRARSRMVHYQCSKAALNAMSNGIAYELGKYGIRSNVISPGLTATQANQDQWKEDYKAWQRRAVDIPLQRTGVPEDFVGAAVFLASDESHWVTGANIMIDGGIATH